MREAQQGQGSELEEEEIAGPPEPVHVASVGAGVQSSTMILLAAAGLIKPMPKAGVFADTQAEPLGVYKWLAWLEKQVPFPIYRVTAGSLEQDTLRSQTLPRSANPPFYTAPEKTHERGANGFALTAPFFTVNEGTPGQLRRQCTREYKIEPINKWLRTFVGLKPRQRSMSILAVRWIGISTDESHRAKLSTEPWANNRHPLLELGMSRTDCLKWMKAQGFPMPSKSACYFCPYHDDALWRDMKMHQPEEFARAVAFDEGIRYGTVRGVRAPVYLHRSCKPLAEVDFRNIEDAGQARLFGGDPLDEKGFAVECEGMCGL